MHVVCALGLHMCEPQLSELCSSSGPLSYFGGLGICMSP